MYDYDMEAFWWCLNPYPYSSPFEHSMEFRPILRNVGSAEFGGNGTMTVRLKLRGNWRYWAFGEYAPCDDYVYDGKIDISVPPIPPGEIRSTDGFFFSYVPGEMEGSPNPNFSGAGNRWGADHVSFEYDIHLDGDENRSNDSLLVPLGMMNGQDLAYQYGINTECEPHEGSLPGHKLDTLMDQWADDDIDPYVSPLVAPGMVIGLWHTAHAMVNKGLANPSIDTAYILSSLFSNDAETDRRWYWWMIRDQVTYNPKAFEDFPPGVVLGLRHSMYQATLSQISVYGLDAVGWKDEPSLFMRHFHAGDLGAPAGEGFSWVETSNLEFDAWDRVEVRLPYGTILGLSHVPNLVNKPILWRGEWYDAASDGPAPPGFIKFGNWDEEGDSGQGFCWYQKTTGPYLHTTNASTAAFACPNKAL